MLASVNFSTFNDIYNAKVSLNKGDSLLARVGLALEKQTRWLDKNNQLLSYNIYGIGNFYTEFMSQTSIIVDDIRLTNKSDRYWAELGLGGAYYWNNGRSSLYGEVRAQTSLRDFTDSYGVKGTVGLKFTF